MLNISFKRNSLLYGESYFLVAYAFFIPYFFWPDSYTTKTKHMLIMTKGRRRFLRVLIRLWDHFMIRLLLMTVILGTLILYALTVVTLGSLVQKDALVVLVGVDEDKLAYKVQLYVPIVYRIGTVLLILIAVWNRSDYREWPTFDHFDVFSVNRATQLRTMLVCGSLIIPDVISSWADLMFAITFLRSDRHNWLLFTRSSRVANVSFIVLVTFINVTSCIIRYKPYVSVIYSAICVGKHMRLIRSQLFLSFSRTNSFTAGLLMGRLSDEARPWWIDHKEVDLGLEELSAKSLPKAKASWQRQEGLEVARKSSKLQVGLYMDSELGASRKQPAIVEVSQKDLIEVGADDPAGWNEEPLYEIHSLFEFEKHLTQIYLFVASMGRCSPGGLFGLTFCNLIAFFYCYLYQRSLPSEYYSYTLTCLFLSSRILPVCMLFIAGHLVERECRKIANLMEIIYLENSSHSLLYGQLKGSQYSLARIFQVLGSIKFDGDGLMALNLDSLMRIMFYVLGAIFIVIQYDSLLIIEESPSSTSDGITETPLGADRTNLSDWLKIKL